MPLENFNRKGMNIKLSKREERIIKQIARLQIASFQSILEDNTDEDIKMLCIQNNLDPRKLMGEVLTSLELFESIHQNPVEFFNQPEDEWVVSKTILFRHFRKKKYRSAKSALYRKIALLESDYFNYLN